jgi:hypothetical protein
VPWWFVLGSRSWIGFGQSGGVCSNSSQLGKKVTRGGLSGARPPEVEGGFREVLALAKRPYREPACLVSSYDLPPKRFSFAVPILVRHLAVSRGRKGGSLTGNPVKSKLRMAERTPERTPHSAVQGFRCTGHRNRQATSLRPSPSGTAAYHLRCDGPRLPRYHPPRQVRIAERKPSDSRQPSCMSFFFLLQFNRFSQSKPPTRVSAEPAAVLLRSRSRARRFGTCRQLHLFAIPFARGFH